MKFTKTLMTSALLGSVASIASADTISFSTIVPQETAPYSVPFSLPGFDTTQGTLTGITLSSTVTGESTLQLINFSGSPQNFSNGDVSFPVVVTGPDSTSVSVTIAATGISGSIGSAFGPYSFPGPTITTSNNVNVAPANFADYEGTGTFNETFNAANGVGSYSATLPGGVLVGGTVTASEDVTITYTFNSSAPEPAPMSLLGFGLTGLVLIGRKKRFSR